MEKMTAAVSCFILISNTPVYAQSLSEKQQDIDTQAQQQKQKMDEATQKLGEVSEKMRLLQEQLDAANTAYSQAKAKLDDTNAKIDELQIKLDDNERSLIQNRQRLQKRVRSIYMHGRLSYLQLLFGAQNFTDFLQRAELVRRVLRSDYDLLSSVLAEQKAAPVAAGFDGTAGRS